MTYDEALEYIHTISWRGSKRGLSRTQALLEKFGSPEKKLKFIFSKISRPNHFPKKLLLSNFYVKLDLYLYPCGGINDPRKQAHTGNGD